MNEEDPGTASAVPSDGKRRLKRWLKRIGWLGVLFFLIKGLIWIFLAYILVK